MVEFNIQHIKNNLDFYESIYSDETEASREFKSITHPRKLREEIEQWTTLLRKINHTIFQQCNHNFISDSIDLNPDRSESIYYCQYCFLETDDYGP
jgi:hypothetical protein